MRYRLALLFLFCTIALTAQQIPNGKVTTLKGDVIELKSIFSDQLPVVVSFWTTTCIPCLDELNAFAEQWELLQAKSPFKLVAIAIDDSRSASKVSIVARANDWPFQVFLDKNQDIKRAMQVNLIPHVFVFDAQGKQLYSHVGYSPGQLQHIIRILEEQHHAKK